MVQVENEYASYGQDAQYISQIRDDLQAAGFDVPFFTCDEPSKLSNGARTDIFCAVNFGSEPEKNLQILRSVRPMGPLMVSEFYPGWFDSWGKPHHYGETASLVRDLAWMLDHDVSFSLYMAHGGTSFGFSAGANSPPFAPQTTSYDYDAPITEAGWETPKFFALRELCMKHLQSHEKLPAVPARNPVIRIDSIQFQQVAPLFANLPAPKIAPQPQPMEVYGQPHGAILYQTLLPPGGPVELHVPTPHDYCLVFLDGKRIATLDRRLNQNAAQLPSRNYPEKLVLLVDSFGRVNYGKDIVDSKGISGKVVIDAPAATNELSMWEIVNLPLDDAELGALKFKNGTADSPAFYQASFNLLQTGDTFMDMSQWGKGMVWVNGHNLGRFWSIGPQQTLYCPGPWLTTGSNTITVFELNGARGYLVMGRTEPVLNEIKPKP